MKTVTDVSKLTGISVRTLHCYDEIGLCKPTAISKSGYRLYDDKALEKLQQILYFKEFDIPLKDIKTIMENSGLDKNTLLKTQKEMLLLKKQRLERIIGSIEAYSKRYQAALQKLASLKNYNINTFEVKEIVGELEFITRQLYQLNDASSFMLETAKLYKQDENIQKVSDQTLG